MRTVLSSTFNYLLLPICLLVTSCKSSLQYSYEEDNYPKFAAELRKEKPLDKADSILTIVCFNIEFSQNIKEAIQLLRSNGMEEADFFLLQEMDEKGVHEIASAFNLNYVYYPAANHPVAEKNIGSAVLTKGTIIQSKKIKLPYPSSIPKPLQFKNYKLRKTATVATVRIHGKTIVAVSTHAPAFLTTNKRQLFAESLVGQLDNLGGENIIVGGDFNTFGAADMEATFIPFKSRGYHWATRNIGTTVSEVKPILRSLPKHLFQLDHLYVKNLQVISSGKIEQKEVSDHLPIWIKVQF